MGISVASTEWLFQPLFPGPTGIWECSLFSFPLVADTNIMETIFVDLRQSLETVYSFQLHQSHFFYAAEEQMNVIIVISTHNRPANLILHDCT